MKIWQLIATLFLNFYLCLGQSTETSFVFKQPIEIVLEFGQHYEAVVPTYFDLSQSVSISSAKHEESGFDLELANSSAFQILTKQTNKMVRQNELYNYGLADPDEYFSGNKKIYRFADLKKLIGVLDMIHFNNEVIVLFQSGYYSFYSIEQGSEQLTLRQTKRLLSNITNTTELDRLSYSMAALNFWGNMVKSEDGQQLLFIGEEKAFLLDKQKRSFELLKHKGSLVGASFEKAIMHRDNIICAAGEKGIQIYTVELENMELKFSRYFKPSINEKAGESNQVTELNPIDIAYDYNSQKVILIDETEGLCWLTLPEGKDPIVLSCEQKRVQVQGCEQLHIVQETNTAIALCPKPMVVNLETRGHTFIEDMDFTPTQIVIYSTKVYMFSKHQYAIYDMKSHSLQQGLTGYEIDFTLIVNQSILTVNKFYIAKSLIVPEISTFYISMDHSESAQFIGTTQILVSFEGSCPDLLSESDINKRKMSNPSTPILYNFDDREISTLSVSLNKTEGRCQISQPLIVRVKDSSNPSHILEIVVSSFLGAVLILGGLFYWNENRQINNSFQQLVQQQKSVKIQSDIQSACTLDPQGKVDL